MSNIRKLLAQTVTDKVVPVEHDGETYEVKGRADAALLTRCQALTETQIKVNCKHLTTVCKREIDEHSYRNILLVHNTLQSDDPDKPYQVTEIAQLCVDHGILFTKLLQAAMDVLGLTEAAKKADTESDPIAEMAVKN